MSAWQPMDSAPRDGRFILAYYNGGNWHWSTDNVNCNVVVVAYRSGQDGWNWRTFRTHEFRESDLDRWAPIP